MKGKDCFLLIVIILFGFSQSKGQIYNKIKGGKKMELKIKNKAIGEDGMLMRKYTCDGINISPPLEWTSVPEGTKTFALILDDPDAPIRTFVHWVIFDLPADMREIPENIPNQKVLDNGVKQGINDFRKIGYKGPCPPRGMHRYFFKLYALDTEINLKAGIKKKQLLEAMQGHIIEEAKFIEEYRRH